MKPIPMHDDRIFFYLINVRSIEQWTSLMWSQISTKQYSQSKHYVTKLIPYVTTSFMKTHPLYIWHVTLVHPNYKCCCLPLQVIASKYVDGVIYDSQRQDSHSSRILPTIKGLPNANSQSISLISIISFLPIVLTRTLQLKKYIKLTGFKKNLEGPWACPHLAPSLIEQLFTFIVLFVKLLFRYATLSC